MQTQQEQHEQRVIAFMDSWLNFAKNPATVACPVTNMHRRDVEYYSKRILLRHDIEERIDENAYEDLSELHAAQQKYAVIEKDFDDLYRKIHYIAKEIDNEPIKRYIK